MSNPQKHMNGFTSNDLKVTFKGTSLASGPTLSSLFRSSVPCFLFLFVYGINGRVRILPRASDLHCVTLHNISTIEGLLFPVAPHRILASVHNLALDALSALPYLLHYLIPLLYPAYLYTTGRSDQAPRFLWLLGWSMWVHYLIWFLLPTAPPWVQDNVDQFRANSGTVSTPRGPEGSGDPGGPMGPVGPRGPVSEELQHREGCAFARLDRWTGVPLFHGIFAGNPVPFASFPSGHLAWPMSVLVTLPTARERRWFGFYVVWVAWATMYSCHHYLTDIVAAVLLVVVIDRAITWWSHRPTQAPQRRYKNAIDNCLLLSVISAR